MAVISPVSDEMATKELLKSKGDELVYHTIHENIVLEIRQDVGLRRFDHNENQIKIWITRVRFVDKSWLHY